uniref:Uncharacterized protein n=1 Tax=Mycena chlorophos TaxID=658473 RepID=A0ABQ0L1Z6_MYCCL|nr:predicted protein [Mycena chlorophos]
MHKLPSIAWRRTSGSGQASTDLRRSEQTYVIRPCLSPTTSSFSAPSPPSFLPFPVYFVAVAGLRAGRRMATSSSSFFSEQFGSCWRWVTFLAAKKIGNSLLYALCMAFLAFAIFTLHHRARAARVANTRFWLICSYAMVLMSTTQNAGAVEAAQWLLFAVNVSLKVIIAPCILLLGTLVTGVIDALDLPMDQRIPLLLGVATNLLLVGLCGWRIRQIRRDARAVGSRDPGLQTRYGSVLAVIAESGALYIATALIVIITRSIDDGDSVVYFFALGAATHTVNIVPTLAIVRTGLGYSSEHVRLGSGSQVSESERRSTEKMTIDV